MPLNVHQNTLEVPWSCCGNFHCRGYHVWVCFSIGILLCAQEFWYGVELEINAWIRLYPTHHCPIPNPFVPESPRWLMGKERHKEAFESLKALRLKRLLLLVIVSISMSC